MEGLYEESERRIYHYFDGEKVVRADPMPIYRRVMEVVGDLQADITVMNSPSKGATEARRKCAEKAYRILAVKPLDQDGGLTEAEVVNELFRFWNWCDNLKKNTKSPPTSAGGTSDSSPSPPGDGPVS